MWSFASEVCKKSIFDFNFFHLKFFKISTNYSFCSLRNRGLFRDWEGISGNRQHFRCKLGEHWNVRLQKCLLSKQKLDINETQLFSLGNIEKVATMIYSWQLSLHHKNELTKEAQLLFSALLSVPQDLKGFHRNRRDLQISTDLIVRVSVSLEKLQKAGDNKRTLLLLNLSLPWIPTNGQIINGRVSPCLQIRPIVIVSARWQAYALALFPPSWQLPRWGPGMRTAPHKPHPPPLLVRLTLPSALTPFNRNRPYTKLAAGKQKNYQIEQ